MKLCRFIPFTHKKRLMPKLIREGERNTGRPGPKYACTRCGKLWYDYAIYVGTIEGRRYSSTLPFYEGQRPPKGYASWKEYRLAVNRGREEFLKRLK